MFLDHDMRSVPPRWEPPRRPEHAKRQEAIAITLVILVSALALLAPMANSSMIALVAGLIAG